MLEEIKSNIARLISLYESEKQRADALEEKLAQSLEQSEAYRKQITDLNQQIDNIRLASAFTGAGDNRAAKDQVAKLIREIDKCIKLLEK